MEKRILVFSVCVCMNFYRRFRAVAVKLREELKRKEKRFILEGWISHYGFQVNF